MKRILSVLLWALVVGGVWYWGNRPVPLALSFNEPFSSVSFAPYRFGESPISHDYPTPEEIDADLASLKGVTRGIRTYTAREGMDAVPGMAAKYGLNVIHSAWLGPLRPKNDLDVAALIQSANDHPDTIKRVIVGNEVLLRKDLPVDELIGYIRKVKAAVKQPVSYADVWAFWLKYPQVADEVDFITIHILPYWEDEPVSVADAAQHLVETYQIIQQRFPGKPILIGESGWPTRGRQRGPAPASVTDAAQFVRTLAQVSKEKGFDYNLVEAFDQPWKAELEGTVGANWGVVDSLRRVKYAMSGPVQENRDWAIHAGLAVVIGMIAAWRAMGRIPAQPILLPGFILLLSSLVAWQGLNAYWIAYDWIGLIWAVFRFTLHAGLAVVLVEAAIQHYGGPAASFRTTRWGERLVMIYASCAILDTVILLVAGRYRDIPNLEFLVPALGITAFALLRVPQMGWVNAFAVGELFRPRHSGDGFDLADTYCKWLWASVVMAPLSEAVALSRGTDFVTMHPKFSDQFPMLVASLTANHEMLIWGGLLVLLSLPFAAEWCVQRRG